MQPQQQFRDPNAPVAGQSSPQLSTPSLTPSSSGGNGAEDRWVRRELPHYESDFTVMTPIVVSCCCFNVGCKKPGTASELTGWLATQLDGKATPPQSPTTTTPTTPATDAKLAVAPTAPVDIIVVGLQEIDMSVTSLLKEETEAAEPWINLLREKIGADRERSSHSTGNKYYPIASRQLVGLLVCVFVRKALMPHVHDCSVATVATGAMGSLANKGAIGVSLQVHSSRFIFINAHLAAGQGHCEKRNEDIATILGQLVVGTGGVGGGNFGGNGNNNSSGGSGSGGGAFLPNSASANPDSIESLGVNAPPAGTLLVSSASTSMFASSPGDNSANIANVFNGGLDRADFASATSSLSDQGAAGGLLPQDHDVVIVLGDLNYRVELPYETVVPLAERGDLAPLLARDQLLNELKNKHTPWKGFTDCTPNFPPTYRFDFGTSRYDTSDKKRIPAFTDRVLYWTKDARHGSGVQVLTKACFSNVMSSDHKPIRVQLVVPAKEVVVAERRKVVERLFEKVRAVGLDRAATAKTTVTCDALDFGETRYWEPTVRRTVTITNVGECVAVVAVSRRAIDDASMGAWMRVRPMRASIVPGQCADITIECVLDRASLGWMAKCKPFQAANKFTLKSFLVLSVENGPVHFVECAVRVTPSVFGNTLENMVHMRQVPCVEAYAATAAPPPPEIRRAMLPKELWFLCEALYHRARQKDDLFMEAADHSELQRVMEHLDTKCAPIPEGLASVDAVAHTLLNFLRDLAIPVVPQSLQQAAIAAGKVGGRACFTFVQQLPPVHCNVFIYLMSLFRFLLRPQHGNRLEAAYLAQVTARVLLGPSTLSAASFKSKQELRAAQAAENDAAVNLIMAFLSSGDNNTNSSGSSNGGANGSATAPGGAMAGGP